MNKKIGVETIGVLIFFLLASLMVFSETDLERAERLGTGGIYSVSDAVVISASREQVEEWATQTQLQVVTTTTTETEEGAIGATTTTQEDTRDPQTVQVNEVLTQALQQEGDTINFVAIGDAPVAQFVAANPGTSQTVPVQIGLELTYDEALSSGNQIIHYIPGTDEIPSSYNAAYSTLQDEAKAVAAAGNVDRFIILSADGTLQYADATVLLEDTVVVGGNPLTWANGLFNNEVTVASVKDSLVGAFSDSVSSGTASCRVVPSGG